MNTTHDTGVENQYDYLVGVLNQLRRYSQHSGMTSDDWSPNLVAEVLHTMHAYRQFSSEEIVWLSDNL